MFRSFFLDRRWWHWSILGTIAILSSNWVIVQIDVRINDWFGEFYDFIQQALAEPGATTIGEFFGYLVTFGQLAAVAIVIQTVLGFFVNHYVFRWRTAMNDYYMSAWPRIRHVEGAAQRVQEDCMIFARIVQGLGVAFIDSIMTLIAFMPVLWGLSGHVQELPWIGEVDQALVFVAIISAAGGTVILALAGIKLPGLEFRNQLVEAAYRKELVYGEDDPERAAPPSVLQLFGNVRKNYFRLYLHYFYFGFARSCYLQTSVLVPYVALGPTIIGGMITLGVLQQIIRAFNRVEGSFQFLVFSWGTIVELISVYKRLKAFEREMNRTAPADGCTGLCDQLIGPLPGRCNFQNCPARGLRRTCWLSGRQAKQSGAEWRRPRFVVPAEFLPIGKQRRPGRLKDLRPSYKNVGS